MAPAAAMSQDTSSKMYNSTHYFLSKTACMIAIEAGLPFGVSSAAMGHQHKGPTERAT